MNKKGQRVNNLEKQICDAKKKLLKENAFMEFTTLDSREQNKEILWLFSELAKKVHKLDKTINRLSIATSLSFFLAFLLIGHKSGWI